MAMTMTITMIKKQELLLVSRMQMLSVALLLTATSAFVVVPSFVSISPTSAIISSTTTATIPTAATKTTAMVISRNTQQIFQTTTSCMSASASASASASTSTSTLVDNNDNTTCSSSSATPDLPQPPLSTSASTARIAIETKTSNNNTFNDINNNNNDNDSVVALFQKAELELMNDSNSTATIDDDDNDDNAYIQFAKEYPFVNNFIIASLKTVAADLLAQTVIAQTPISDVDLQRSLLFCIFGGLYSGAFQYVYQVQLFKRIFKDIDAFTNKSIEDKLKDIPGIQALLGQTALDLTVLTLVYLPTFYIFKASVFSHSGYDPHVWFDSGLSSYMENFSKDESALIQVWLPADIICFSVPLYLRMPARQSVSFLWTAYLSFARGGH
jgi:hypothetical protein